MSDKSESDSAAAADAAHSLEEIAAELYTKYGNSGFLPYEIAFALRAAEARGVREGLERAARQSPAMRDAKFALGQLRHLYSQMIGGNVRYPAEAARGLLGPAIAGLEPLIDVLGNAGASQPNDSSNSSLAAQEGREQPGRLRDPEVVGVHDPCNLCGSEYHCEGEHRRMSGLAEALKQARYWLAAAVVPVRVVREQLLARIDAALAKRDAAEPPEKSQEVRDGKS